MSVQNVWLEANPTNFINPDCIQSINIIGNFGSGSIQYSYVLYNINGGAAYTSQTLYATAQEAFNAIAAIMTQAVTLNANPNEIQTIQLT